MTARLHYVYDPLCGWCYAAAPLVRAARDSGLVSLVLHGGGMLVGDRRRPMTQEFRDLIRFHEQRMYAVSGQPFGDGYTEGLLRDPSVVYDSGPPTIAILAVQALTGRGAEMYEAAQRAHYVQGRSIFKWEVLASLAADLGVQAETFAAQWAKEAVGIECHYGHSRALLEQIGGLGFPTLALEQGRRLARVDHAAWYGKPDGFVAALREALDHA